MANETPTTDGTARFLIKGQYIKDLSFENPHAPHSLITMNDKPKIDLSITLKREQLEANHYELTLLISLRAMGQDRTLFVMELAYSGLVQCVSIPDDKVEMILFIDCAFALFPFARRVVADVTRDGGFPALMLEPIDFHALYLNNRNRQQAEAAQA